MGLTALESAVRRSFSWRVDVVLMYVVVSLIYLHKITGFHVDKMVAVAMIAGNVCLVFGVYALNALTDRTEDAVNGIPRDVRLHERGGILCGLAFLVSLACYAASAQGRAEILFVWTLLTILGVWYSVPRPFRLKDRFLVKNLVPAFSWLLSVGALISASFPALSVLEATGFSFSLFFLALTFEILWDMPDREGDRVAGIPTIPSLFGILVAKTVIVALLLSALVAGFSLAVGMSSLALILFTVFVKHEATKHAYHIFLTLFTVGAGLLYLVDAFIL